MSFGLCPHTGKTFAEKFPPTAYRSLPGVTRRKQYRRALTFETDGDAKRYLFFALNPIFPPTEEERKRGDDDACCQSLGAFFSTPEQVKAYCFRTDKFPGDMRHFVVDPTSRAEVAYMAALMSDFWSDVEDDEPKEEDEWWRQAILRHLDED